MFGKKTFRSMCHTYVFDEITEIIEKTVDDDNAGSASLSKLLQILQRFKLDNYLQSSELERFIFKLTQLIVFIKCISTHQRNTRAAKDIL